MSTKSTPMNGRRPFRGRRYRSTCPRCWTCLQQFCERVIDYGLSKYPDAVQRFRIASSQAAAKTPA